MNCAKSSEGPVPQRQLTVAWPGMPGGSRAIGVRAVGPKVEQQLGLQQSQLLLRTRPPPGDERRKLQAQAQKGDRRSAGFRRTLRRPAHTDAVPSRSQNSGYSTCLWPGRWYTIPPPQWPIISATLTACERSSRNQYRGGLPLAAGPTKRW